MMYGLVAGIALAIHRITETTDVPTIWEFKLFKE